MLYFRCIGIHPVGETRGWIDKDNEIDDVLKDELRAMQGEADTDKLEIERGILLNNVDSIKRTSMD